MTLDQVAVIPAKGIGDGLICMVASHRLMCQGYNVTTFSKPLSELSDWFEGHHFQKRPNPEELEKVFSKFDLIVMQNDNTDFAKAMRNLYQQDKLSALSTFYPTYDEKKHGPLFPLDRVFHEKQPMVDNIARAISSVLGLNHISKNNGLKAPSNLKHRAYKNRVILHPTSTCESKNWTACKYVKLAEKLQNQGYHPMIAVSPKERPFWLQLTNDLFDMPLFPSLNELAHAVYESGYLIGNDSGTGHLASNMQLPTLIISNHIERMKLWRPGWYKGEVLTPSRLIPNIKGIRLREKKWKHFISESKVLKAFQAL